MSRFVRPEKHTLTLANGDQLIVRSRLSAGEQRAMYARLYTQGADGRLQHNPLMSGMGIILAYLLDWTLQDDDGRAVVIRDLSTDELQQVIDSLDPISFHEIKVAIEQHEEAMLAARADEKKTPTGGPPS